MEKLFINRNVKVLSVQEVFERFLRDRECSNVSPHTISYYERCFKSFGKF